MADLNIQSIVGTRVFKCAAGTAGASGATYTELPSIEETSGGGISNNSQEYVPHDTGVKAKVVTTQEYGDVTIKVAKIADATPAPYDSSTVRILNDLAKARTKFDLIKCVPTGTTYEATVWTGFITEADVDDATADGLQRGDFTFAVSARAEFTGSISGDTLTLTARS